MATRFKRAASFSRHAARWYSLLSLLYIILIFILPVNHAVIHNYHLSNDAYRALSLLVVLPLFAVWLAAFYGYAQLKDYSLSLAKSEEAKAFSKLTNGCRWLAWGLPLSSLVSLVVNSIASQYAPFYSASIIIVNYLNVFISLVGFYFISHGAQLLTERVKIKLSLNNARSIISIFVVLGISYCYLTFHHLAANGLGSTNNPYYLPSWLMIITIIIPYLYIWFIGLLAIYEIRLYGRQVHGILYRQPMQLLAGGLLLVVACSAGVQYIHSVIPRTGHLKLNLTLLILYIVYILAAVGYYLISLGARRLKRIEEV